MADTPKTIINKYNFVFDPIEFEKLTTEDVVDRYRRLQTEYPNYTFAFSLAKLKELLEFTLAMKNDPMLRYEFNFIAFADMGNDIVTALEGKIEEAENDQNVRSVLEMSLVDIIFNYFSKLTFNEENAVKYSRMINEGGLFHDVITERSGCMDYYRFVTDKFNFINNKIATREEIGFPDETDEETLKRYREMKQKVRNADKEFTEAQGKVWIDPDKYDKDGELKTESTEE